MKKLFFSLSVVLFFSATSTTSLYSAFTMQKVKNRLEAFKHSLFHRKEPVLVPLPSAPPIPLQMPPTTPVIFYYPKKHAHETARITLINVKNSNTLVTTALPSNTFHDVNFYNLSPKKRYLLIHKTKTEGLASRLFGDWLGKKVSAIALTQLIDAKTSQEITSFNNDLIMYEFSPDETTLLIATAQKTWREKFGLVKPATKGASPAGSNKIRAGKREQSATGEILRYDLFNISSKKILQTFENIQLITYLSSNKLFIKYDNGEMEIVTIEKQSESSSLVDIFNNFFTPATTSRPTTHDPFKIRTEYDEKQKIFTLQIDKQNEQLYGSTLSYHLSPNKQYILIQHSSEAALSAIENAEHSLVGEMCPSRSLTKLINLKSGKEMATFENLVTHEFSDDEKKLLVLCTHPRTMVIQIGSSEYLYRLYDITKEDGELIKCDETPQSAYFIAPTQLVIIDKDGKQMLAK